MNSPRCSPEPTRPHRHRFRLALVSAINLALAIVLTIAAQPATAQAESVTVTRKTADLYGVMGDDVLLMTAGCDVYALATPAKLQPEGGRMVLRFDGGNPGAASDPATRPAQTPGAPACALRDMLKPQAMPWGRYEVRLSYDSPDWYEIEGTSLLLRTVGCQRRSSREPAVWFQPMEGKGVIEYRSGAACNSDGVFGSVRRKAREQPAAPAK
ncbi:hypothetical protein [Piscinibacter sakaiensis]|uniref:hypothetical protein n=1 Tax=Piscinibacter sakaiensis TaxID=1547922 RepID=UPI003AAC3C0E